MKSNESSIGHDWALLPLRIRTLNTWDFSMARFLRVAERRRDLLPSLTTNGNSWRNAARPPPLASRSCPPSCVVVFRTQKKLGMIENKKINNLMYWMHFNIIFLRYGCSIYFEELKLLTAHWNSKFGGQGQRRWRNISRFPLGLPWDHFALMATSAWIFKP